MQPQDPYQGQQQGGVPMPPPGMPIPPPPMGGQFQGGVPMPPPGMPVPPPPMGGGFQTQGQFAGQQQMGGAQGMQPPMPGHPVGGQGFQDPAQQQAAYAAQQQFAQQQQMAAQQGMGGPVVGAPVPGQDPAAVQAPVVPIGHFGRDQGFKSKMRVPTHNLNFDEQHFLTLLAGSISLSKEEKKRIIESIPKLSQYQIDELIKIFEEEKRKFSELDVKHQEQLQALEKKHAMEWEALEMEQDATDQAGEENAQADDIRKSLGLADD